MEKTPKLSGLPISDFDWVQQKRYIIEWVLKFGWPEDFDEMVKFYGKETIRSEILGMENIFENDLNFISAAFDIDIKLLQHNFQPKTLEKPD